VSTPSPWTPRRRRADRPGRLALLVLVTLPIVALTTRGLTAPPPQRGIALGLFAEDPGFSYLPLLQEIRATGASHVSVVIPYYQHSIRSITIGPHPRFTPTDDTVQQVLRQAGRLGLKVLLFPILRLEYAVTPQEWRGTIQPRDAEVWWRSYRAFILKFARLAHQHRAAMLCIGSELGSMDTDPAPWRALIHEVRATYHGKLIYSANWDHYREVRIWPLVDAAGLSAYYPLIADGERATLERLIHGWREVRVQISRFRAKVNLPLVFTELGYHSQHGTSAWPWDESADRPVSLEGQRRCYQAFIRVWGGVPYLQGIYFWNWFGYGGSTSHEYCPRGKPAAAEICRWFAAGSCPTRFGQ